MLLEPAATTPVVCLVFCQRQQLCKQLGVEPRMFRAANFRITHKSITKHVGGLLLPPSYDLNSTVASNSCARRQLLQVLVDSVLQRAAVLFCRVHLQTAHIPSFTC